MFKLFKKQVPLKAPVTKLVDVGKVVMSLELHSGSKTVDICGSNFGTYYFEGRNYVGPVTALQTVLIYIRQSKELGFFELGDGSFVKFSKVLGITLSPVEVYQIEVTE